ncbi:hypothetical protein KFL_001120060 [Klebsormidium nitens]|uniref:Hexosyltransferase n=1 Tax=Klebsormidium nitens TaxID=105231 RepID=A0A1Y1HXH5_KLENI|nr:hypothetical protein KFL_001120060 [Klebsormidium nitens]|eukprot:GAQ82462.1 hypothetical protein KFL_001120060 [Klebsormidium nitens]
MSGLEALTEDINVQTDTTSDEDSEARSFVKPFDDWWHITILIHTTKETWETQAAAVKATWLAEPLPPGVRLRPGLPKEPKGAGNERAVQSLIQVLKTGPSLWYIKVSDETYVNLAAITSQSLASLESPQERPHYVGDCACSWEEGNSRCSKMKYFDCSVFARLEGTSADGDGYEAVTGYEADTGGYEAVTKRIRRGYACGGPGYILSYAAVKQFVAFEQESGAARGLEDMMIGDAMQRHLGTTCTESPIGTFALVTIEEGETSDIGIERARASNRTLGTMYKMRPDMMRTLHQQLADRRTGSQEK